MNEKVKRLIEASYGSVKIKKEPEWNGYEVYKPILKNSGFYIGYPFVVLVKGDEARWSNVKETLEWLGTKTDIEEVYEN